MANIANLITKLSGIIASLDDIRDAISHGGGGSSTASGVSVTPTSPLTGTNLQATTNETAALLQDHADEISTLNSSLTVQAVPVTNTREGASITASRSGKVLMVKIVGTGEIPSGTWTEIGRISGFSMTECTVVVPNGTVTGFGFISVDAGIISVFHTLGGATSFFNSNVMTFITS